MKIYWTLFDVLDRMGQTTARLYISQQPVIFDFFRGKYVLQGEADVPCNEFTDPKQPETVDVELTFITAKEVDVMANIYSHAHPMSCPTIEQAEALFGIDLTPARELVQSRIDAYCQPFPGIITCCPACGRAL